ncbi:MAG: hypothetical protein JWP88_1529 [Flaviaesturariibacter sp.]|nr:hypothetical protein [Flaviaesturariibacter sp.]
MKKKESILAVLVLLLFGTFFSNDTDILNGIIVGCVALAAFLFNPLKEKWTLLKSRPHIWFQLLFFGMLLVSIQHSDNEGRAWRYLDTRLALLYFPVSIGLIAIRKEFKEKALLGLALITTAVSFFCLVWGIHRSGYFKQPELLYNDSLTEVIRRQSVYISLLVNISVYIFGYWVFYKPISDGKKLLMLLGILFLFIISFLLASRNMMMILYGVSFCFILYYLIARKKYLEGSALLIGILMGAFLIVKFSPKTLNRFKELTYTQYDYKSMGKESHYNMEVTADQWNGANFRLAAWPCGWHLFKQQPLLGVGLGDKQVELKQEYARRGFTFGVLTDKNIHNNYLDVLYATGIISFVFFLLGWVLLPLWRTVNSNQGLSFLIILTIAIAMVTEIYFDRTLGGMVIGFLIPFVLAEQKQPLV